MNQPIAPQAFAETAPLFFDGYFVGSQGLQLETKFQTYAQLYLTQPWVATVVDKIAGSLARLGVNVWDTSPATGNVLDLDSPYAQLMANPGVTLDPYSFWQWLASTIEIYGEAYLLKVKDANDKTRGFIPMHPAMTQTFRDQLGNVAYWFMGQPNELMSQDMVVPFLRYNPNMTQRGVSRLEPLRSTLANEDSTRRGIQAWWKNLGRPSGFITVEGKLDQAGKERLRQQWNQLYQGSENIGSTVVLENGSKFEMAQQNAEEMQYIESRKLNREEVCAVYDVPPPVVHILDKATYANISAQMRSMYRDTMAPRLEFIESAINHYVGREFGLEKLMRFDVAEVMRGDMETRAESWSRLVQTGIAKPSEARPYFDLGDGGPVADRLYAQQQIQPLGTPQESAGALPPGQSDTVRETPSSGAGGGGTPVDTSAKYMRDIGGRIGKGATLEQAARAVLSLNPDDETHIAKACMRILDKKDAVSDYFRAYLIRHGHTTMSPASEGWSQIPLSDSGRQDAAAGGAAIAKVLHDGWPRPNRIVSSDLERAKETGRIAGKVIGLDVTFQTDVRLRAYGGADIETSEQFEERLAEAFAEILALPGVTLIAAHRSTTAFLDEHYVHHDSPRLRAPDYDHDSLLHLGGVLAITRAGILPVFRSISECPAGPGAER